MSAALSSAWAVAAPDAASAQSAPAIRTTAIRCRIIPPSLGRLASGAPCGAQLIEFARCMPRGRCRGGPRFVYRGRGRHNRRRWRRHGRRDGMRIAVLGGGNGSYAAAADLAEQGHEVRLWRRAAAAFAPVLETGTLLLSDHRGRREVRLG